MMMAYVGFNMRRLFLMMLDTTLCIMHYSYQGSTHRQAFPCLIQAANLIILGHYQLKPKFSFFTPPCKNVHYTYNTYAT